MKNDNSKRTQQLMAFMKLADEKKDKGTMKDMAEKTEKLSKIDPSQLTSAQKRGRLITKNLMRAYDPNETVVWHSLFMPAEIFQAMDIVPFSTEMISAGIAGAGLSKGFVESGEEYTMCRDSCSFSTCTVGAVLQDVFPTPDFLVTTSQLCDPEKKLGRFAASEYGRKDFFIDVPYGGCTMKEKDYNIAVDYVARQLEHMVAFIERETGKKLDSEKLEQTLQYSNEAREWYLKVCDLRMKNPPLISGVKILDFSTVLLNIWGTKESADIFKSLYEELYQVAGQGGLPNAKYRIAWIHLRPYYDNTIINYLEKDCGAYIVVEEINYIFWDEHDTKDPYRSIARKLLKNPAFSPMNVRYDIYSKIITDTYSLDGAVGFTQKGCRHFYSSIHMAADKLKDLCTWLVIDGDCVDPRAYSFPLIKTRVDSFVDMMDMRRNAQ